MSAYSDAILATAGLVAYYRMDDAGSTAVDSKSAINGTYTGSPPSASGLITDGNGCHDFNGSSQYVAIAGTSALQPANVTCEGWVNIDTFTSNDRVVTLADDTVGLQVNASGQLEFTYWQGTLYRTVNTTGTLNAGVTYHVSGSFDNATVTATTYINGVQDGQNSFAAQPIVWDAITTSAIGSGTAGLAANDLDARIDEVAIYNVAVPQATLLAHYQLGVANPTAPNIPNVISAW